MSVDQTARGLALGASVTAAAALPKAGGTLAGNVIFGPDATYDIGGTGVSRPRDVNLSRNVVAGNQVMAVGTVSSSTGPVQAATYLKSGAVAVASLPAAGTAGAGARMFVTDATVTTFASTVVGGGANKVPVVSDGTNWIIG